MASHSSSLSLFIIFNLLASIHVLANLVCEEGYTVTTVLNGYDLSINPQSVFPRPGSSDFIILDSEASSFFTVSLVERTKSSIKLIAGNGKAGFSDGDLGTSMFSNPKSFAVDLKGNVYVADKSNHVIRKISNSGVTTIAGGYSRKTGKVDGPAQNASFSNNFELTFVPAICALLISDHGNKLVRQIDLKSEDCAKGSQSVLGMASAWTLGLGVSCLIGLIVGFAIRPFIIPYEGSNRRPPNETWKHFPINLGRLVLMFCFDIRSAIVSSPLYALLSKLVLLSLSHLSLMFRINPVESQRFETFGMKSVSLIDSDVLSSKKLTMSPMFSDPLTDLISLDGAVELSDTTEEIFEHGNGNEERRNVLLSESDQRIDDLILTNLAGFTEQAGKSSVVDCLVSGSGLVKRR